MTSENKKVGKSVEHHIDENIKRVYDEALHEEVPERFQLLLEKLKKQTPIDTDKEDGA